MTAPALQELVKFYTNQTYGARTRREYAADYRRFAEWCRTNDYRPLPAEPHAVILYLTARLSAGKKITTVRRDLSGIKDAHTAAGFPHPADDQARQLLRGAQRLRCEQATQKRPLTVPQLKVICANYPDTPPGIRDRAIITLAFASALRQVSVVGLELRDVEFVPEGILLQIRHEKQDRVGRGRVVAVGRGTAPTCPVENLRSWLMVRGDMPGPVFVRFANRQSKGRLTLTRLWPKKVSQIVKAGIVSLGLSPAPWGGHSTRSGIITAAFEAGAGEIAVATHSGHKSLASLRMYYRRSNPFKANISSMVGL